MEDSFDNLEDALNRISNRFDALVTTKVENILGMEIEEENVTEKIHHVNMIPRILELLKIENCNTVRTQLPMGINLICSSDEKCFPT